MLDMKVFAAGRSLTPTILAIFAASAAWALIFFGGRRRERRMEAKNFLMNVLAGVLVSGLLGGVVYKVTPPAGPPPSPVSTTSTTRLPSTAYLLDLPSHDPPPGLGVAVMAGVNYPHSLWFSRPHGAFGAGTGTAVASSYKIPANARRFESGVGLGAGPGFGASFDVYVDNVRACVVAVSAAGTPVRVSVPVGGHSSLRIQVVLGEPINYTADTDFIWAEARYEDTDAANPSTCQG